MHSAHIDDPQNAHESSSPAPQPQQESERLKLLLDLTNTLVSNLELRDLLRAVSASIRQVMQCDAVAVCLPDAELRHLHVSAMDFPESRGFAQQDLPYPLREQRRAAYS